MTIDILRSAGVNEQQEEQARAAVKAFRALQPTLTSYARVLTGKKNVRVDMAAQDNGSTDGTRIYFRPPIALGDPTPHVRSLCDKRDYDGVPLCKACGIRENVLVTIYHEIAHICYQSFAATTDADKRRAIEFAIKESRGKYAADIEKRIKSAPSYVTASYMGLCHLINQYLPFLVNCLEDARVNRELFKARPGLKRMFAVDTIKVFNEGFENRDADGVLRTKLWREAPLNSQAMIGVFCKASGYEYSNWFHSDVVAALNDEELTGLVRQLDTVRSAGGVYNLAFKVLARLRELGFCGTPQDPDPEPEEEPDEPQPSESEPTPEEDTPEEEDQDSSADSSDSEPGGDGDGTDESDAPPDVPPSDEEQDSDGSGDGETSSGAEGSSGEDVGSEEEADRSPSGDSPTEEGEDSGGSFESDDSSEDVLDSDSGRDQEESGGEVDDQEGAGDGSDPEESGPDSDGDPDESAESDGADENRHVDSDETSEGSAESGSDDNAGGSVPDGQAAGEEELDEASQDGNPLPSDDVQGDEDESGEQAGESDVNESSAPVGPEAQGNQEGRDRDDSPEGDSSGMEEPLVGSGDLPSGDEASPEGSDDTPAAEGDEGSERPVSDESDDPIDTGADDGYGGTEVIEEDDSEPRPEMGEPEDVDPILKKWGDHEEKPKSIAAQEEETAVDRAIIQGIYFTKPSKRIYGVREHHFGKPLYDASGKNASQAWKQSRFGARVGQLADIVVPESILQPAILRMRRAFTDNQIGALQSNRKSGRVNRRVLGRRAWNEDPRLFAKKTQPGKKDYAVIIGMDVSGSTVGKNIALEKRAIMAQATMLDRVGVPFAIFAHTGYYHDSGNSNMGLDLEVYHVKDLDEPWNDKTIERLEAIGPSAANLDGHALEYLRKRTDEARATNKIIMYYSDGKMPAENHDEELEILTSEIKTCRAKGYTLLGVGIRTDSPARHGLDTVQVDEDADLVKVVNHLGKRLSN